MGDWRQELEDKLFPKERGIGGGGGGRKWSAPAKQQWCKHKEGEGYCALPIRKERIGATRCDIHRFEENLGCAEHDRLNCADCA